MIATMICCCKKCRFVFESVALLDQCPDCGHGPVRAATESESAEYAANRRLYGPMPVYGMKHITAANGEESMPAVLYDAAASS